eukprot:jgi/Undpi1/342/HiC_scaffold_1.g00338.m1
MSGALRCINRAAAGKNVVATASAAVATAASQQGCTLSTISTTTATTTTTTTAASVRSFPSVAPAKPSPPNSGGGGCSGSVDDKNATSNQEGDDSRGRGGRNPSPHHHHHHQHHLGSGAGVNMHSNGGFREGAGGGAPGVGGGRGAGGVGGLSPSMSYGKRMVSSKSSLLGPAYSGGRTAGAGGAPPPTRVDAVVVGAGQAGLSVAYHLQKAGGLRFVTLDANQEAGGAWRHRWPSLELFSTRKWSSLPGYPMFANGACEDGYPSTREMAMYMEEYESVMKLNVVRPVTVKDVSRTAMGTFLVETDCLLGGTPARWEARTVVSASGTHTRPVIPRLPGSETFRGVQLHSNQYRSAEDFRGARVAVVGAGNSGAQILAEVSYPGIAKSSLWSTLEQPSFLPVGLSGKEIFDSVARLRQSQGFVRQEDIPSINSIIMQRGVVEAAERGVYEQRVPSFTRLTPTGVAWDVSPDGNTPAGEADVDVIIWCTGYENNTSHLSRLGVVREDSTVAMDGRDVGGSDMPGIFAVGYGNWAGVGSGSIPGSTVYAKRAATAAVQYIRGGNSFDSSKVAVEAAMTGQLSGRGSSSMSEPYSANSRAWPTWRRASVASSATGVGAGVATVGVGAGTALAPSGVVEDERVMAA